MRNDRLVANLHAERIEEHHRKPRLEADWLCQAVPSATIASVTGADQISRGRPSTAITISLRNALKISRTVRARARTGR
jgi:hypothetical protein